MAVEPVKCRPAKSGSASATSLTAAAVTGDHVDDARRQPGRLEQPHVWCAASCCVTDGFHTTVLPISAGAVGRLPAMAVKLNGVIATTKPSSGRWSNRFHTPGEELRLVGEQLAVRSGR